MDCNELPRYGGLGEGIVWHAAYDVPPQTIPVPIQHSRAVSMVLKNRHPWRESRADRTVRTWASGRCQELSLCVIVCDPLRSLCRVVLVDLKLLHDDGGERTSWVERS
jgi:hypothetical protein